MALEVLKEVPDEATADEGVKALSALLRKRKNPDAFLQGFFRWLDPTWREFWSRFRPDGTMSWYEFEQFVHWESNWTGDTKLAFELMQEPGRTLITTYHVNAMRQQAIQRNDMGENKDVQDWRRRVLHYYGHLGRAWRLAFDTEDTGHCCFNHFCRACHAVGIHRHLKTVWEELTGGAVQRCIQFRDFDPEGDRILEVFATALTIKYGSVQEGWFQIIQGANGQCHKHDFVEACAGLHINPRWAKWLYSVLDLHNRKYLSRFMKPTFVSLWDHGDRVKEHGFTLQDLQKCPTSEGFFAEEEAFEFTIELTKEEHEDYMKRRLNRLLLTGRTSVLDYEKEGWTTATTRSGMSTPSGMRSPSGMWSTSAPSTPWRRSPRESTSP